MSKPKTFFLACSIGAALLAAETRAAAEIRPDASGEVLSGGGIDTNMFLQVAASPDSPTWHPSGRSAFGRLSPSLAGALTGERLRLSLLYQADLRWSQQTGLLAQQEAIVTLAMPDLGRSLSAYLAAAIGRYDSSTYPQDRFVSLGGETGAALRLTQSARLSARYRFDRRGFGDPMAVQIDHDWTHTAEARLDYVLFPWLTVGGAANYLGLRSTLTDPDLGGAELDRYHLEIGAGASRGSRLILLTSAWGGLQTYPGLEADRQIGGSAALLVRMTGAVAALVRYDVAANRAVDPASTSYSRQQATVALVVRATTASTRAVMRPAPQERDDAPVISGGTTVRFKLRAPDATTVSVVGSWNEWQDEAAQRLTPTSESGLWEGAVVTGPGRHRYRFLVDGRAVRPPGAPAYRPDGFGGEDGVVEVVDAGQ